MPTFAHMLKEDELWKLVVFLKHLDDLTPEALGVLLATPATTPPEAVSANLRVAQEVAVRSIFMSARIGLAAFCSSVEVAGGITLRPGSERN